MKRWALVHLCIFVQLSVCSVRTECMFTCALVYVQLSVCSMYVHLCVSCLIRK